MTTWLTFCAENVRLNSLYTSYLLIARRRCRWSVTKAVTDKRSGWHTGKDVSEKLYAVAEQASLPISSGCQQQAAGSGNGGRLSSSQAGGSVGLNGSTATAATSSFGPWESEVSRSQSADAVHTVHTGQMRSIHWRRDETRKVINSYHTYLVLVVVCWTTPRQAKKKLLKGVGLFTIDFWKGLGA